MPKRPYHTIEEVSRLLDPYRFEMSSGMKDEAVAKKTGLSVRAVQRWRLREGLRKPRGAAGKQLGDIHALSAFGEALGDVRQRTTSSAVGGTWEPPAFVTRQHIDYHLFLRLLDAGERLLGLTEDELGRALGMTPRSIEQGLLIAQARRNQRCATCGDLMFSGEIFCSSICKRLHGHRQEPTR